MKTRHWVIYLFVWAAYFLTLFCTASCKTATKTVMEDHYITEQSEHNVLDESWQERMVSAFEQMARIRSQEHETAIKETIREKDSTSTTLGADGKPIKTERFRLVEKSSDKKEVMRLQDSIYSMSKQVVQLKAIRIKMDSLIRLKQDSIHVLSRELTKAERRYMTLGEYTAKAIWAVVVIIIAWALWRRCKMRRGHEDRND